MKREREMSPDIVRRMELWAKIHMTLDRITRKLDEREEASGSTSKDTRRVG